MTAKPHPDDCREGLLEAASRRADASRAKADATIDLADWAIRARAAGIPMTEIAGHACVTRKAVYDLIAWREGRAETRT